jgi:alkylated DNA repair dioxygenase AlkB
MQKEQKPPTEQEQKQPTEQEQKQPTEQEQKQPTEQDLIGECSVNLIPEYGVIHLQNALSSEGQQRLWNLIKPRIQDPSNKATGFHCFHVCAKDHPKRKPVKRIPEVDYWGKLLFTLSADALVNLNVDASNEPSFQRLLNLANGSQPFQPGQVFGNYYRANANLLNHVDSDQILFTMTLAIGDDCEFHVGRATNRSKRMSERNGKVKKIRMKSGDAVYFDGGSTPHEVVKMIEGTGPSWWNSSKVGNGSRLVMVFREQESCFYDNKIKKAKLKKLGSTCSSAGKK